MNTKNKINKCKICEEKIEEYKFFQLSQIPRIFLCDECVNVICEMKKLSLENDKKNDDENKTFINRNSNNIDMEKEIIKNEVNN